MDRLTPHGAARQEPPGQHGSVLVLVALSTTVLLAMAALSIDASLMYDKRNRLHAAADAAAKSAALEYRRDSTISTGTLQQFAMNEVARLGFTAVAWNCTSSPTPGVANVCVNRPPSSGPFTTQASYVEAIVSEPTGTIFGRILGVVSMTPGARAVAGFGSPGNCLIVNEDLSIGNTTITTNGCGVGVGDDLAGTNPNSTITGSPVPSVAVTGDCTGTCGSMGSLTEGAPKPQDPFARVPDLANPYDPATCLPSDPALTELEPGCYSSINVNTRTLKPGIYYITGPVHLNPGSLSGSNVMLYLAGPGASLMVEYNNLTVNLTGITNAASPYNGIAIFQARDNNNPVNGGPKPGGGFKEPNKIRIQLNGAIYMPGADVDFKNGLDVLSTTCSLFVARSLTIKNGNGSFANSGCASQFGGAAFLSVTMAE